MASPLLTPAQAAEYLTCTKATVSAMARRGDLRSVFIGDGRLRRFHVEDLDAYIASRRSIGAAA